MALTYATFDSGHMNSIALSGGDLLATEDGGVPRWVQTTISESTGKYYCEFNIINVGAYRDIAIGVQTGDVPYWYNTGAWIYYGLNGKKCHNGSWSSYGNYFTTGYIVGVALDMDNGKIWCSLNGVWQNSGDPAAGTNEMYSGVTGNIFIGVWFGPYGNQSVLANFGQNAFAYTVPSGFFEGFADVSNDLAMELPAFGMEAYGGGYLETELPAFEMEIYAFTPIVHVFDTYITGGIEPDPIPIEHIDPIGAQLDMTLPAIGMAAYGGNSIVMELPFFTMEMEGVSGIIGEIDMTLPFPGMEMKSGGYMELTLPALQFEASGMGSETGDMAIYLPAFLMEMVGTVNIDGDMDLDLPAFTMYIHGTHGLLATLAATLPAFEAEITGYHDINGDLDLNLPMPVLLMRGSQENRFDSFVLDYDADETGCS